MTLLIIERPWGGPVVLLPLEEYLAMAAALGTEVPEETATGPHEAEIFSLEARRRHRQARAARTTAERRTAP